MSITKVEESIGAVQKVWLYKNTDVIFGTHPNNTNISNITFPADNFSVLIDVKSFNQNPSSTKSKAGTLYSNRGSLEFPFISKELRTELELLGDYAIIRYLDNIGNEILLGNNIVPLKITVDEKPGTKPENGSRTIVKFTLKSIYNGIYL